MASDLEFVRDYFYGGKKGSKKSKANSAASLFNNAGLTMQRGNFAVRTSSDKSFTDLLDRINSIQSSTLALNSLGTKPKDKKREGLLSKLLGQESGILTAPARAVTALAADVFKIPFDDPTAQAALEAYNPLEAAFRSAKGEFAITGGDVFRVNDGDNFGTRLAKWGAALVFDIATDPTSYVGNIGGPLSRKSVAVLAVRDGEQMLAPMSKALAANGIDSAKVIDTLFQSSPAGQLFDMGHTPVVKALTDSTGAINSALKMELAGKQFGTLLGSNLYRYGRSGVIRGAADLFAIKGVSREIAEKAAKEFVSSLPKELGTETGQLLAGGIYLKTPFKGKPILKLKSASLEGNAVSNLFNEAYFRASSSGGGQWVSRNLQGRYGKHWAEVKKAMIPGIPVKTPLRSESLYRYVDFKDEMARFGRDAAKFTGIENAVGSSMQAIRHGITDPTMAKYYEAQLSFYFWHPLAPISVNTTLANTLTEGTQKTFATSELNELDAIAKATANEAHAQLNAARQLKIDSGFTVGNRGQGWAPLMFRDDVYEALRVSGGLKGPDELRYAPGISRAQEVEFISNDELSRLKGYRIDKDVTALSPQAANEAIGKITIGGKEFDGMYEENPIIATLKYLHEVHNAVTHKRLITALELSGTITVLPRQLQDVLQKGKASLFVAAMSTKAGVTSALVKRSEESLKALENELKRLVDQQEVSAVSKQVMDRIKEAQDRVQAIDVKIEEASTNLRNARRAARMARPTVPSAQRVMQEYAQSGIEQSVEEAQRVARNAASRTSKATKKAEETAAQAISTQARANQPIYDPETFKYTDASVARAVLPEMQDAASAAQQKLDVELVTLSGARNELEFAKQLRQDILNELGPAQVEKFTLFEEALQLQYRAAEELDNLRELRRGANRELVAANADTTLQRASALQAVVENYVQYRRQMFEIVAKTGRNVKLMNSEEKLSYEAAKDMHNRAKETLFTILEHSTRKKAKGVGRAYAEKVIKLSEMLSAEQFRIAEVISDANALRTFADSLDGVRLDSTRLQMVGDMVQAYKNIRNEITYEDLVDLGAKKSAVLEQISAGGPSAIIKKELRASELSKELFIEQQFEDYMRLGSKGGVKLPASMADIWTTKGIRGVLEDIYKVHAQPTEWEQFISRVYDPLALVWRVATTVGRGPGFILNNVAGGHMNNYLGGVSAAEHGLSGKILATAAKSIRDNQAKNPNLFPDQLIDLVSKDLEGKLGKIKIRDKSIVDLYIDFFEKGGHFDTDTFFHRDQLAKMGYSAERPTKLLGNITVNFTDEPTNLAESSYRRLVKFLLDNRVQSSFSDAAQASEIYLRFAAFISGYRRFGNLDSAMDLVYMLHFNYQDLANAEVWFKRFIPFYTWARNNVPLQLRSIFLSNSRMATLVKANEEFKRAMAADENAQWLNDYLPDWMQIQGGFASYFTFGGNHLGLFNKLPMTDVDKMFEIRYIGSVPIPVPRTSEYVNMLGPVGKTTIEWLTNRNYELGYEYKSLGDKVIKTIENNIPYVGIGRRAASAVGYDVDKEKRMSNLFGLLVGTPYGITTITEKSLNSAAYSRQAALSQQVKQAAADAGVDPEWLQKRIKAGDSLTDLRTKIIFGQGSATKIAIGTQMKDFMDKLEGKESKKKKDYGNIVRGLQTGKTLTGY